MLCHVFSFSHPRSHRKDCPPLSSFFFRKCLPRRPRRGWSDTAFPRLPVLGAVGLLLDVGGPLCCRPAAQRWGRLLSGISCWLLGISCRPSSITYGPLGAPPHFATTRLWMSTFFASRRRVSPVGRVVAGQILPFLGSISSAWLDCCWAWVAHCVVGQLLSEGVSHREV